MATETETTVEAGGASQVKHRGSAFRPRDAALLVALLVVAGALAALLIHGPPKATALGEQLPSQNAARSPYEGLAITPKREPSLVLRNYLGDTVNIKSYLGKAVLVTFLYTHCPDVCPLIASRLHTAIGDMRQAERSRVQVIAVSVDPVGDTPTTVADFLHEHGLTGEAKYLIGNATELSRVWAAWGIGAKRDVGDPALISHVALVYGITASGKVAVIYPASFAPSEIVHDVPRLAAA